MRQFTAIVTALILSAALSPACAEDAGPKLKVGDAAPKLQVSGWLNGKAVDKFEKDKVYVIECWATWCGPCINAIPHVSKMNTRFKDKGVVIIGLNVWEEDQSKVEPFIKKMGEKLNYVVALDDGAGDEGKSAKAWLKAAGQDGIPCTFVVDKEGKVAWIGHPMAGLEQVVEQVVEGKFDAKKEAAAAAKMNELEKKLEAAGQAEKWDDMLKVFDEIAALRPAMKAQISATKVAILLLQKKDFVAGYELAGKLLETDLKDEPQALNELAWLILKEESVAKRDFDVALKLAARAGEVTKYEESAILDTLAAAHFAKKQLDKAIEYQTKAVAKSSDPKMTEDLKATLEKYKGAKEKAK